VNNLLKEKLEAQRLKESADLYAEIYLEDSDLKVLTDSAVQGWPSKSVSEHSFFGMQKDAIETVDATRAKLRGQRRIKD
jgi:hypothetical protein